MWTRLLRYTVSAFTDPSYTDTAFVGTCSLKGFPSSVSDLRKKGGQRGLSANQMQAGPADRVQSALSGSLQTCACHANKQNSQAMGYYGTPVGIATYFIFGASGYCMPIDGSSACMHGQLRNGQKKVLLK